MAKIVPYFMGEWDIHAGVTAAKGSKHIVDIREPGEIMGMLLQITEAFAGSTTEVLSIFDGSDPAAAQNLAEDVSITVGTHGLQDGPVFIAPHGTEANRKVSPGTTVYLGVDAATSRSAGKVTGILLVKEETED